MCAVAIAVATRRASLRPGSRARRRLSSRAAQVPEAHSCHVHWQLLVGRLHKSPHGVAASRGLPRAEEVPVRQSEAATPRVASYFYVGVLSGPVRQSEAATPRVASYFYVGVLSGFAPVPLHPVLHPVGATGCYAGCGTVRHPSAARCGSPQRHGVESKAATRCAQAPGQKDRIKGCHALHRSRGI